MTLKASDLRRVYRLIKEHRLKVAIQSVMEPAKRTFIIPCEHENWLQHDSPARLKLRRQIMADYEATKN